MRTRHLFAAVLLSFSGTLLAADFLTEGVDNGRTGWVKDEKIFTRANVGSTKLLWKLKLDSTPRAAASGAAAMRSVMPLIGASTVQPRI